MPPIKEMLKLTTNIHPQPTSDRDLASQDTSQSVNPGFVREHGDRAPDAPNLVVVPVAGGAAPTTTTLFDLLTPFAHTALVFELPQPHRNLLALLQLVRISCMRSENIINMVNLYPVVPENTPSVGLGRAVGAVHRVFVDTQGHARRAYDIDATQAWKNSPSVIIIRPDTYIGAFVYDVQGIEKYFSKIFV